MDRCRWRRSSRLCTRFNTHWPIRWHWENSFNSTVYLWFWLLKPDRVSVRSAQWELSKRLDLSYTCSTCTSMYTRRENSSSTLTRTSYSSLVLRYHIVGIQRKKGRVQSLLDPLHLPYMVLQCSPLWPARQRGLAAGLTIQIQTADSTLMFPARSTPCPLVRVQCIHTPAACTAAHSFDVSVQHPNTCVKQETHCRSKGQRESSTYSDLCLPGPSKKG